MQGIGRQSSDQEYISVQGLVGQLLSGGSRGLVAIGAPHVFLARRAWRLRKGGPDEPVRTGKW